MNSKYFIEYNLFEQKNKNYKESNFTTNWFTESPIDEEHKYYQLLGFLQIVDINVANGFLYQEYDLIETRYKDLELFAILNYDEDSVNSLDGIVTTSIDLLKQKYLELKIAMLFANDNIKVTNKNIIDESKNIHIYIEKSNCGIKEHYTLSKKGKLDYIRSFHSLSKLVNDTEHNSIEIDCSASMYSEGIIIPYLLRFILSKN